MTTRTELIAVVLTFVVGLSVVAALAISRISSCEAQGGRIDWLSPTGALCLTDDGRVIR